MNSRYLKLTFASLLSLVIPSMTAAEDQKAAVLSCYDSEVSNLKSSGNRDFSSQQFRIVCQHRDIAKREKNETFAYFPPENFRIVSAEVEVVLKSSQTSIGDLDFHGQGATISLQCRGRPEDELVHDAVSVKIVGRLEYLPTPQDTKGILSDCLDRATMR